MDPFARRRRQCATTRAMRRRQRGGRTRARAAFVVFVAFAGALAGVTGDGAADSRATLGAGRAREAPSGEVKEAARAGEALRWVMESPCDVYSKSFAVESGEVLRRVTVGASERACARERARESGKDSQACAAYKDVVAKIRTMSRDDVITTLRLVLHEACQSAAMELSDPEKRSAAEAEEFVKDAVRRSAEEEATAGKSSANPWGSNEEILARQREEKLAKDEERTTGRGIWGWSRDVAQFREFSDAFGDTLSRDSIQVQERNALMDIYRRTNGANWRRRDRWMSAKSYCTWYGVTCQDADAGVTFVDLRDNNLRGDMPQAIDELRMLQGIDMSHNRLEGRLNPMIGELKALRYLLVRSNELYSNIPAGVFRKDSALVHVDLSDNMLSGAIPQKEFMNLHNLRMFNVSVNSLSGGLPDVSKLPMLEVFSASTNSLRGELPHFERDSNMRFFDVSKNLMHGTIPPLHVQMPWVLFDVSGNSLSGELLPVEFPRTLRVFSVGNNNLNGSIPLTFGKLPYVEHLDFSSNKFTGMLPSTVMRKPSLRYFNASQNALEGELPQSFYQGEKERSAMKLAELDVSHNRLTGELPRALVELENIRVINVAHNKLAGELPSEHWSTRNLIRLDVKANAFTGRVPPSLATARKLEYLDLSQNRFTSRIDLSVLTIPTLTHLDVAGNDFDWTNVAKAGASSPAASRARQDPSRAIKPPRADEL